MADNALRKIEPTRVRVEPSADGATFRKRVERVQAWRWQPQYNEGAIVQEPGMKRLQLDPGVDACAWLHPSGAIIPDNGNPAYVWARNGQMVRPCNGDVIIKHADGTRTVMSPDQFVQEYEPA
jgi:hypothetical protein